MNNSETQQSIEAVQRYLTIAKLHLSNLFASTNSLMFTDAIQSVLEAETHVEQYIANKNNEQSTKAIG